MCANAIFNGWVICKYPEIEEVSSNMRCTAQQVRAQHTNPHPLLPLDEAKERPGV
jgi:hypothetical protein